MRSGQACSVVHIENSYASGLKKRPRGPRSVPVRKVNSQVNTAPQRPLVDLKTTALWYYLHYHLQRPDDPANTFKGLSDEFVPIWKSKSDCLLLDLAISSMSLAVFSRTKQHLPAATEASATYHQLLKTVRATLPTLNNDNVDTYLIATFFMGRYENVVHCINHLNMKLPFATTLQSFSHHDGASAILKVWKTRLSYTHLATDIIKHSRRGLIRSALLRKLAVPGWMQDGTDFGEDSLDLEFDRIMVRLANVRQRLSVLLKDNSAMQQSSNELESTTEEINEEARGIDQALQEWKSRFPSPWFRQRHHLSGNSCLQRGFYSPTVYSHASPAYAALWNQYYATSMLANSTRLRALEVSLPNADYDQQRSECHARMRMIADELAATVPFCLQRFYVTRSPGSTFSQYSLTLNTNQDIEPYVAGLIVWPLGIASGLREVDEKQRKWFRSELTNLGRLMGDRVIEDGGVNRLFEL